MVKKRAVLYSMLTIKELRNIEGKSLHKYLNIKA